MLFNSFDFLWFFPLVVIVYYILRHQYRWMWLLLASYYFYFVWEPSLVLLLFVSTCIDYFCSIYIHRARSQLQKKILLYLSVCTNLGLLGFFKYLGFLTETTQAILQFFGVAKEVSMQTYDFDTILLPIGISFYTFQTISYTIDVYRKRIVPVTHFGKYALYVSFFPQLVAGPIERAERLLPQFDRENKINIPNIRKGLIMMGWGFFLKLVVADRLGIFVDYVFAYPEGHKGIPLILGSYFFTLQIYYDFSAYSTIALGIAQVMGFTLMQNFNRPMFFKNMSDFWRRWHISLMDFLGNYIYRPLARKRKIPKGIIVLFVFLINGLWHGANWTFVIWGLLCGGYLLFETWARANLYRFTISKGWGRISKLATYFWWFVSINFVAFTLIFFRSPTVEAALGYLESMMVYHGTAITDVLKDDKELLLTFVLVIVVQIIHYYKGNDRVYELVTGRSVRMRWVGYILFIIALVFLSINRQHNFIYFQF